MVKISFLIIATILWSSVFGQSSLDQVKAEMISSSISLDGDVGFYVKNLRTGEEISFQADSIFPTASMIKIPILVSIMDKISTGAMKYHEPLIYDDSLLYEGEDILGSVKSGDTIAIDKVIMLMLTMSDNTASLWLQQLGGTGTRINELMANYGLDDTRMNSRTPGRKQFQQRYGWGQSTPREMASLLEIIYKGEVIDPATSERMLRNLNRNYWDGEALSVLPPTANVFSKNGAVSNSRSEVILVNGRNSDYLFCIMTKNLKDTSWEYDNAGWQLIRKFSSLLYTHFEPEDTWQYTPDDRYK